MEPTVYRPQGVLAKFVDYFWTFDSRPGDTNRTLKMFATGVSGVLFQHHEGQPALGATLDGRPVSHGGCPTSFVYGKRTRPSCTFATGPFALTGVVLKPQGLNTLFKIDPGESQRWLRAAQRILHRQHRRPAAQRSVERCAHRDSSAVPA